ncbi:uncharacterized protein UTRI_05229_B [Ustilago trichophora]|uniref:Trafficking protein particle complex subunit 11 domain-containing protein n=1 Tax=Ustilago trichophora TaxID=86804 RepID=A0A5C3EN45_9BASI|nr:uncharacterized protein UTRI_05229_B [Ustilago trichophora]
MNAFPPELLHHHFACMVVAGLTPPPKPSAPPTTAAASASAATTDPASESTAPPDHPTTIFPDLTRSLHDILASRARNTLWDPSRGRAAVFHTVFADHSVRLPPLKTKPSARHVSPIPSITAGSTASPSESSTAAFAALPPRSPLSPLHPNSPQFPDGLIAPVWVRKHRELVPSVFVSFHCLPTSSDAEEARTADEALIKTISERRRTLAERGIKLTIVLLTEREMLDDTQLEARLSFIRRSSGLDSRASLFVLTPVTKPELGEFVSSLHSALFEPAADFYREHARRVKRKRTRYPPPSSTLQPIVSAIATLPPANANTKSLSVGDITWLSREGWIVRSEYKLAVFAELAGDMQEALLRYREAYDLLCNSPTCLLGSTLMLPPRTKRWAEAKVLADTLSVRICKLLLYSDDGEGAAMFFRRHLARFTELSTGWGIGAMTFEYWSWLAKQYRLFGELIEHATRSVPGAALPPFQLPLHAPPLPSKLLHPDSLPRFSDGRGGVNAPPGTLLPNNAAISVSTSPYSSLQSPGAYFYLAALCTVERRTRFLRATSTPSPPSSSEDDSSPLSHERKVDHTAQLTESLTKAYDSFKRNRQHRAALFVAARIATAYHEGGQHEMSLKFLERILKSYAKDEVKEVRAGLLEIAVAAAVGAGDRGSAGRLLIEVLDAQLPLGEGTREGLVRALKTFLGQSKDSAEGVKVEENEEKDQEGEESRSSNTVVLPGFVEIDVAFPTLEVEFGSQIPFQLVLRNTSAFDLGDVFSVDRITFSVSGGDGATEMLVEITSSASSTTSSTKNIFIDLDTIDATTPPSTSANLAPILSNAGTIAIQGTLSAAQEGLIHLTKATLHVRTPDLTFQLPLTLPPPHHDDPSPSPLRSGSWLLPTGRTLPLIAHPITTVLPQRFRLALSCTPPPTPTYIDERTPLTLTLRNHEQSPINAWLEAVLEPSYDGSHDTLSSSSSSEESGQAVKNLAMGTIQAGEKGEVEVWLTARQAAGMRVIDVSVRVTLGDGVGRGEKMEAVEGLAVAASASVAVAVVGLFDAKGWVHSQGSTAGRKAKKPTALLDFDSDEEDEDGAEKERGETSVRLDVEMVGDSAIDVAEVELMSGDEVMKPAEGDGEEEHVVGEWIQNDRFSVTRTITKSSSFSNLAWRLTWTRLSPSSLNPSPNRTLIPINPSNPSLPLITTSPSDSAALTLSLTYPLHTHLHTPFDLTLTIHNHHPTRTFSLILTLDSDDSFTLAATRRLSIPFLLPQQTRTFSNLARLVPLSIGRFAIPNVGVRLVDPQNPTSSLALVNSNDALKGKRKGEGEELLEQEEEEDDDGGGSWRDVVKFEYGGEHMANAKGLPKVLVRL